MNNMTWIVVADAGSARIFSTHKASLFNGDGKTLTLIDFVDHLKSRKLDQELVTDKQGRFGNATFSEKTDPHKHEADVFALELARKLTQGLDDNQFKELIFIAPPHFMGLLKKHTSSTAQKLIGLTVEKDYTHCNEHELVKHLQEYL